MRDRYPDPERERRLGGRKHRIGLRRDARLRGRRFGDLRLRLHRRRDRDGLGDDRCRRLHRRGLNRIVGRRRQTAMVDLEPFDRGVEGAPLEIDVRLGERRVEGAQLADQRVARTVVDRLAQSGRSIR